MLQAAKAGKQAERCRNDPRRLSHCYSLCSEDGFLQQIGNLYYHFRNKEEIIRALFEQQFARWDEDYAFPNERLPTLDDLQQLVRATFATAWEYRFMYRELIALLRRDTQLHQRWVEVRARGFEGFH